MPAKKEAPPAPEIKKVKPGGSGEEGRISKAELVDLLCVFTTRTYDPSFAGQFGTTPKWTGDVFTVSTKESFEDVHLLGEVARQLGRDLAPGEIGAATIREGTSPQTGRRFFSPDWADGADYDKAVAAFAEAGKAPF